jgi:hypothetical protein
MPASAAAWLLERSSYPGSGYMYLGSERLLYRDRVHHRRPDRMAPSASGQRTVAAKPTR